MTDSTATRATSTGGVIACHECDLLQLECPLPPNGVLRCRRCGAELSRNHPNSLNRALAFTLASIVLFAVGNAFPIVGLEVNGTLVETTLLGAASVLYEDGMWPIAGLVLATTFLMPMLQMVTMTWLLVPLRFDRAPYRSDLVFRLLQHVRPWGMTEVLILGMCRSRCGVVVVRRPHAVACGRKCRVRSARSLVTYAGSPGRGSGRRSAGDAWRTYRDRPGTGDLSQLWAAGEVSGASARCNLPALRRPLARPQTE
jgi:hypothetical protein